MTPALEAKALALLDQHKVMTLATVRPDGWPQATTVGYAHEGTMLYFLCAPDSQKAANIARDNRVSLTIDHDEAQVMKIEGLSMAARAFRITDPREAERVMTLILSRYEAQQAALPSPPSASQVALFRVQPFVISVLDYSKGFGHADLVPCV